MLYHIIYSSVSTVVLNVNIWYVLDDHLVLGKMSILVDINYVQGCYFSYNSVQDCFARYPSGGMLGTTHLILLEPAGEKYKHSLKWGVPAVKDRYQPCALYEMLNSCLSCIAGCLPVLRHSKLLALKSTE